MLSVTNKPFKLSVVILSVVTPFFANGETQTRELFMMRRVLYHCAAAASRLD
jgi:hypothetical protein